MELEKKEIAEKVLELADVLSKSYPAINVPVEIAKVLMNNWPEISKVVTAVEGIIDAVEDFFDGDDTNDAEAKAAVVDNATVAVVESADVVGDVAESVAANIPSAAAVADTVGDVADKVETVATEIKPVADAAAKGDVLGTVSAAATAAAKLL